MDTRRSEELYARARAVIPGGVNSPVRAYRAVGGVPRFMVRGEGAYIYDEDGNRYLDLVQSWGPLPLGHAHPKVVAAARGALVRGSSFGAPTRAEVMLAEAICEAVPSIERVRLTSSGTEAAMSAVRLARAATGRRRVLKFAGHYHGHADTLLVEAGSGAAALGVPGSPGVPPGVAADTVVVPWNDPAAVAAAVDAHGDELAAIICEPVAANMNLVPPAEGFLAELRRLADRCGALLIFDEVITGFRVARGGVQELEGVQPDLTVLGKVVGGGFPLAAFGGRADVMDLLAPDGPVYQAGTLSGNPVAVAAAITQLELLTPATYGWLERVTSEVTAILRDALAGVEATVVQYRTLAGLVFAPTPPRDLDDVRAADHGRYARFFHALLDQGVLIAPSGYEVLFTCTAIDADGLELLARAAAVAARALAEG